VNPDTRIFILAGGLGTRLAHIISDVPKPMAPIAGRPFLEWQIEGFAKQGFSNFVLLVGHKKEVIIDHFGTGAKWGIHIDYSVEEELLGTGGAVIQAMHRYPCEICVIVNGDTYFNIGLKYLIDDVLRNDALLIACKLWDKPDRYGTVIGNSEGQVSGFAEKRAGVDSGFINGGIYVARAETFSRRSITRCSIEMDIFPELLAKQGLRWMAFAEPFVDIGVPEDFERAQTEIPEWSAITTTAALFLDRDGVLIEDTGYVRDSSQVQFLDRALPILEAAIARQMPVIVVSNQAGVAKGILSMEQVDQVNRTIAEHFGQIGLPITKFYFCPHHPDGVIEGFRNDCIDRKPMPGMLLRAAAEHRIDLGQSIMVGDKDSDVVGPVPVTAYLLQGRYPISKVDRIASELLVKTDLQEIRSEGTHD